MARKPNYAFERNHRAKIKAAKREAKRQAKLADRAQKADAASAAGPDDEPLAGTEATEDDDANRRDVAVPPESS